MKTKTHFAFRVDILDDTGRGTCDAPMCWLGGPVDLSAFLDGFPRPRPSYLPFPRAGSSLATRVGWNIRLYAGVTLPRATYKYEGR
jgi:hypothetical protein